MRRAIKVGLAVVAVMAVLPIVLIIMLFVGWPDFKPPRRSGVKCRRSTGRAA